MPYINGMQYKIPEQNISWLRSQIETLNRRAEKLSCLPITMQVVGKEQVKFMGKTYAATVVDIQGQAPSLSGWEFAAVLVPAPTGLTNVLNRHPLFTDPIPDIYRTAPAKCDHCQSVRRRSETFVLRHTDGSWKQVGRNCLKDFLGHPNPERFANMAEAVLTLQDALREQESEEYFGRRGGQPLLSVKEILMLAAYLVRIHGYRSVKQTQVDGGRATASDVLNLLYNPQEKEEAFIKNPLKPEDQEKAEAVRKWITGLEENHDYVWNLKQATATDYTSDRFVSIVTSAIVAHNRALGIEAEGHIKVVDDHYGMPGTTFEASARFIGKVSFDSVYGLTHIYRFVIDSKMCIWKTSNLVQFKDGCEYLLAGGVKEHGFYKGKHQTRLTRVRIKNPKVSK